MFSFKFEYLLILVIVLLMISIGHGIECNKTFPISIPDEVTLNDWCALSCDEPNANAGDNVGIAFGLVAAAGLSTTFGAAMVFFDSIVKRSNKKVLAMSLGFASGVMLYVSFVEIFYKSVGSFQACNCLWVNESIPDGPAKVLATVCFFGGVIFFLILEYLTHLCMSHEDMDPNLIFDSNVRPHSHAANVVVEDPKSNPESIDVETPAPSIVQEEHRIRQVDSAATADSEDPALQTSSSSDDSVREAALNKRLNHMGLMTALAIGLHNLPEGLATFVAALADPSIGAALAVAIAIHNIPEGLCVSIPIYYATGSRWRAFWIAFFSGIAEVIGAALGYAFLMTVLGDVSYAILFGLVAGLMVAIVIKELMPTARQFDPEDKVTSWSIMIGMVVMALSLVLFYL